MKIEEYLAGSVAILKPNGPVTEVAVDQLKMCLVSVCDARQGRIVLDASAIAFVDSQALEMLVDMTEEKAAQSGPLKLAGTNETMREVMELTEVADMFEHFEDVESAVRSIK